jgi:D-lactate dehydrogenase (cytochrome)
MIEKEQDNIDRYLSDSSNLKGKAKKVFLPESQNELIELVKNCFEKNININLFGSGTGLTGGAVSQNNNAFIISTEKLNKFQLNRNKLKVTIEPGVIYSDLDKTLKENDLFFPPNPTETSSSLGGNIATNASGSRTFKYGSTRNYVERLKVVVGTGEIIEINRGEIFEKNGKISLQAYSGNSIELEISDINMPDIKNTTGYYLKEGMDAIDLFIGSEGTLGVILEADLRVVPLYDKILGLIIFFDDNQKMLDFVEEAREESLENHGVDISVVGGIGARLMEYFDERSLNVLRKFYDQIPVKAKSAIWIEQEYDEDNEPLVLDSWFKLIEKHTSLTDETWTALNPKEHKLFAEFRHKLPEQVYENLTTNDLRKIGTDTAVYSEDFEEYYGWLYKELEKLEIPYLVFGHIGNSHLHANLFYSGEKQYEKSMDFYNRFVDKTLKLGGTVSAEHGIGKIKKTYLEKMYGEEAINIMKNIKKKLDPKTILNQGNLFN